jgi:exopolysaccharide production protein ExoQ
MPLIALAAWGGLTVVLLWLERSKGAVSWATWIPTIWMLIAASRAVGRWLDPSAGEGGDYSGGSLPDRLVLMFLIGAAIVIVAARQQIKWGPLLRSNAWLFLFFLYLGMSVLWAVDPFVSLKRWVKTSGAIAMALILATEANPTVAVAAVFRRCAYVLVPLSVVLVKYYPELGRAYGRWNGIEMWTGVGTHKNGLGQLCAISILFLLWSLLTKPADGQPVRWRDRADWLIALLGLYLLAGPGEGAYSATSISVTVVGVVLVVLLHQRDALGRFITSNLPAVTVVAVAAYSLLSEAVTNLVSSLLERDPNLTGRTTDIWPVVLEAAAKHPLFGAGYGGVWGLGGEISAQVGVEQAHNGYLDVYLQLGVVGILLLICWLLEFCARVRDEYQVSRPWGLFGVAFVAMTLIYNVSETNFFDVYVGCTLPFLAIVFTADAWSEAAARQPAPLISPRPAVPARVSRYRSGPVRPRSSAR